MIIRHLPFFAVAAEEENLQRAAARLGMTQPALSRRIHDLENELGVLLFERVSGRLKLTPMGVWLGQEARRIVDDVDDVTRRLHDHSGHGRARLSLGLNERAIALGTVGAAIRSFRSDNPTVAMTVKIMSSFQLTDALANGELDLAMLYLTEGEDRFDTRPILQKDPYVAVLAEDHRLAARSRLALKDLDGEDLIWPSRERIPKGFDHLGGLWRAHGLEPHVTTEVSSTEAGLSAVLAGLGIAIIRQSSLNVNNSHVIVREVPELMDDPLPISVAWIERQGSAPARRRFLGLLVERGLIEG